MPDEKKANSYRISDELWAQIEPLMPEHKNTHPLGGGRPRVPDRQCLDGIFYVLRTGCQWKALDATGICSGSTAHSRFQEWVEAGVFLRFWQAGLLAYDELQGIDWEWLSADASLHKAPLGGKKMWSQSHRSGQVRHQAQPGERRPGRAAGPDDRRGQPPRHEAAG